MKTWEIRYGLTEGAYKTTSNSHTPLDSIEFFAVASKSAVQHNKNPPIAWFSLYNKGWVKLINLSERLSLLLFC
jgi:hypothetical protein